MRYRDRYATTRTTTPSEGDRMFHASGKAAMTAQDRDRLLALTLPLTDATYTRGVAVAV